MSDQPLANQTGFPWAEATQEAGYVVGKVVVGVLTSAKVAPILTHWGVTLDPVIVQAAVAGAVAGLIHMAHVWLQGKTNWKWL